MIKKTVLGIVSFALLAGVALAATPGSDNASNYGGTWTDGTNGGTGFGAWDLTNNNNDGSTIFAGYFLGDSTLGSGDINTSGASFAMYANPSTAFADADRSFDSALTLGESFSLQLAVNFTNGNKGFNLYDGGTQIFNFNVGGGLYAINGTDTGLGYDSMSIFDISFTQTSLAGGTYTVSRGASSFNGTYSGDASSFKLYINGTDDGANSNNLYANNLVITVPEPSILSLLGGSSVLVAFMFLRRRRAS